jgi:hypothetical protein
LRAARGGDELPALGARMVGEIEFFGFAALLAGAHSGGAGAD